MEFYPVRSEFLCEKPFQKYRLRITAITAELGTAIITAGNHLIGNTMSVTRPCSQLHVSTHFLHLSEYFLISLYWTNFILITMKCPYRDILNYRRINKIFTSGQAASGRGSRSCEIFRIKLYDPISPFASHRVPENVNPTHINGW